MAIRLPRVLYTKQILRRSLLATHHPASANDVPKGYWAVYVGKGDKKRFVIPVSMLSQPSFQYLLNQTEVEFGYYHPMGGLTFPCREDIFANRISQLSTDRKSAP